MSDWIAEKNEYTDFQFNGKWASGFGLTKICQSNRNSDKLIPTLNDKSIDIPGRDGQYFYYSTYKNKQFSFNFAFDHLTQEQVDSIKIWLGDKKLHQLVLSEDSFINGNEEKRKIYTGKVTNSIVMKHLCFEEDGQDIYKGEGQVQFTCYYPFAIGVNPDRFDYTEKVISSDDDYSNSLYSINDGGNSYIIYAENGNSNLIPNEGLDITNYSVAPAHWQFRIGLSEQPEIEKYQLTKVYGVDIIYDLKQLLQFLNEEKISFMDNQIYFIQIAGYPFQGQRYEYIQIYLNDISGTKIYSNGWYDPPPNIGINWEDQKDDSDYTLIKPVQEIDLYIDNIHYSLIAPNNYCFTSYNQSNEYLLFDSFTGTITHIKNGIPEYQKGRFNSSIKIPKLYNNCITSKARELKPIQLNKSHNFYINLQASEKISGEFRWTPVVY